MPEVIKAKEYETIYVLRGDVDADTAERVQARVAEVVSRENGKLVKVDAWGRRRLAYPVQKQKRGVYVYLQYVGKGSLVSELERNLKLQDSVLKYQTIQLNDDVNMAEITVNPDEVKMSRLELSAEPEETDSKERSLGFIQDESPRRHDRDDRERDEAPADAAEGDEPEAGAAAETEEEAS